MTKNLQRILFLTFTRYLYYLELKTENAFYVPQKVLLNE